VWLDKCPFTEACDLMLAEPEVPKAIAVSIRRQAAQYTKRYSLPQIASAR
jgi:hypothetical protein